MKTNFKLTLALITILVLASNTIAQTSTSILQENTNVKSAKQAYKRSASKEKIVEVRNAKERSTIKINKANRP